MRRLSAHLVAIVILGAVPRVVLAQDAPDLREPAGKEWLSIGGDWSNSR